MVVLKEWGGRGVWCLAVESGRVLSPKFPLLLRNRTSVVQ